MNTVAAWRAGSASDPGLQRAINEDRLLVDPARGIFLVVDGLGGHQAGEMAAQTAVEVIGEQLTAADDDVERRVRSAISEANNRILHLARTHREWAGMACVLTLAVVREERVTVGHVGDSRLYLFWNGKLRKLTSDHSPVGEQEDGGELDELAAMRHPRRNEVFRDVGSAPHEPDDRDFIETRSVLFRPDAALLLCSDGLSDTLTSAEMAAILERYDGDPDHTAQELVTASNQAGAADNISAIFIAGPEFVGKHSATLAEARPRHAITRIRTERRRWRPRRNVMWMLLGLLLGILGATAFERRADLAWFAHNSFAWLAAHAGMGNR